MLLFNKIKKWMILKSAEFLSKKVNKAKINLGVALVYQEDEKHFLSICNTLIFIILISQKMKSDNFSEKAFIFVGKYERILI
jgi:hypothetical protein